MHGFTLAALILPLLAPVRAVHLSEERLDKVLDVLQQISRYSWENGTKAEAIIEWDYPSLGVFSPTKPIPLPNPLPSGSIPLIMDIAQTTMENRAPQVNASADGGLGLVPDAAAADPASLGVAVLLANASTDNAQVDGVGYGTAATAQLNYLLYDVPRTSDGAISHRADQPQLWADFIYMVPPFLAYYGALNNNQTLLQIAHAQIGLYRQTLKTDTGLWAHILLGQGNYDPGLWATGNAWAAAGMLRVLATMKWSQYADQLNSEMSDLQSWTEEILGGSRKYYKSGQMLHNYINDTSTFEDSSASALMAAAALRMSTLNLTTNYVQYGIDLLSAVSSKVNSTGYVTQVVDPYDFQRQGEESAEAQSFVLMAYAAYNEWTKMGNPGVTDGSDPLGHGSGAGKLGVSLFSTSIIALLVWVLV